MSKCIRGGNTYKRHHADEKGVCKNCGQKTANWSAQAARKAARTGAAAVPAQNVQAGQIDDDLDLLSRGLFK